MDENTPRNPEAPDNQPEKQSETRHEQAEAAAPETGWTSPGTDSSDLSTEESKADEKVPEPEPVRIEEPVAEPIHAEAPSEEPVVQSGSLPPPSPPPGPYTHSTPPPGQPVPPAKFPRNWGMFVFGCLAGCLGPLLIGLFVLFMIFVFAAAIAPDRNFSTGDRTVAVIRVSGVITGGRGGGDLFSATSGAERIIDLLEEARADDDIKAVVIRINSPGGSAAGSEEIYNEIRRVRDAGKPVVASMADVAASGGYYIAAATDEIVCDAATLTGSIGVIMELMNFQELFGKVGIDVNTIKSGKHKDIGSYSRAMTPEERQMLQAMVNDIYQQFVENVEKGRKGKLTLAQIRKLADGRVFTGRQAVKLKLADRIGGLDDAVRVAGRRAGVSGEPDVKELGKPSFWEFLADPSSEDTMTQLSRKMLADPRLMEACRQLGK